LHIILVKIERFNSIFNCIKLSAHQGVKNNKQKGENEVLLAR